MANSSPGRILIIDDDPDSQSIYEEVLKSAGYLVEVAKDGEEAYTKISQGGFDVILLDIMMPKIDGINVLKKLKANPPTVYNGPIIVISALNSPEIINNAMKLGAKGYIVKSSINPDQLVEKVAEIIQGPPTTG